LRGIAGDFFAVFNRSSLELLNVVVGIAAMEEGLGVSGIDCFSAGIVSEGIFVVALVGITKAAIAGL